MKKSLSEAEINNKILELSEWFFENNCLKKTYTFETFRDAMSFILRISYEVEELEHHPALFNCFNRVDISLNTHDVGNKVTQMDFDLALAIDSVA
ncbi:MAG: 4a-hydroxytetrahydrobiopterin dehydratase [Opitutae bacterium]|jgi:4a-hydroxytetrahydrobiopterin dehydratase|nr:4a-hydroxytetrahydrobiopterin dehydratase [Opitutae bacterium]MBT5715334.1 4a-hydroxytetrahydrobiopterin dehydratase [Opitutae bacterium]